MEKVKGGFDRKRLGASITARREALHMTQAELARRAGCTLGTVSRIERGESRLKMETLFKIASALQCRASELVKDI